MCFIGNYKEHPLTHVTILQLNWISHLQPRAARRKALMLIKISAFFLP